MSTIEELELDIKEMFKGVSEIITKLKNEAGEPEKEHWKQPKPWPQVNDNYYFIDSDGRIDTDVFCDNSGPHHYIKIGNFFKTEEDAKASALYTLLNSEYNYYVPGTGQPKPLNWDELEVEKYHHVDKEWNSHEYGCHDSSLYRWKKAGQ